MARNWAVSPRLLEFWVGQRARPPSQRTGAETTRVVEWQHPRFRGYGPFASAQGDGPLRPCCAAAQCSAS